MKKQNGNPKNLAIIIEDKKPIDLFSQNSHSNDNQKKDREEIPIEILLENDELFNDLRTKSNSQYLKLITLLNILKLIDYCLKPNSILNKESKKYQRYPYYSCLLLCSDSILLFSKSINHIKNSSLAKINKENEENKENKIEHIKENDKIDSLPEQKIKDNNSDYSNQPIINLTSEEIFDNMNSGMYNYEEEDKNFDDFFNFKNDFEENEKYVAISETEIKIDTISKKKINEYDEEEKKIINNILDEIFKFLDFKYPDDQTYMGYFQKIVNYLLFNESDIILNYLFKEPNPIIKKFYKHLDKAAIQNIIENILNILADKEENINNIKESKYIFIIQDILQELNKDTKFDKAEFCCELIINTLINNSDTQLIALIFNKDNNIIIKLKVFLEIIINKENFKKINKENNDKAIIGISQIICQLNNILISSFNESLYYRKNKNTINFVINDFKNSNKFEYQYFRKKNISFKKIFEAFQINIYLYYNDLNIIFNLIKEDIYKKYNEYKEYKHLKFGLRHLYEWKLIASILQIYIYSFYTIDNLNNDDINNKYFNDKKLFKIMIKNYFNFPKNNLYHTIFIEIIKIICNEKCPEYLVIPFLKDKNNKRNKFIYKIIKNIKELNKNEKNNNNNLLLGTNIEILRLLYLSSNPYIINIFEKYETDKIYKNNFIDYINPKLERDILDEWEYTFFEIFNNENDNNKTFDGNDIDAKKNYDSFQNTIQIYLNKCKNDKRDFTKNNNIENNFNHIINIQTKVKEKSDSYSNSNYLNIIKENKIFEFIEKKENFGINVETKFDLEEII